MTTVLTDGDYQIDWHGGRTFEILLFGNPVNAFTVGDVPPDTRVARQEAREWWYTLDGKGDTQLVVRESAW